ncbi:replication factor A 1 [Microthyrium microscopicum]|uniref:Replication protein A subunit n=1 Tax=Microthyrium microscopicum TaxID=703497 RepID=A0A6A6UFT5_9PEZI|nr:replication factor A 1 [Microthyrium microscopicum]
MDVITKNAIPTIFGHPDGSPIPNNRPILQVLHLKPLQEGARYRVILSDTNYFVQSMLAGNLKNIVADGILKKGSIVELEDYHSQVVNGSKRILVLSNLNVLAEYGEPEKIGGPKTLDSLDFPDTAVEPVKQQPQGISGGAFYGAPAQQTAAPTHNQPRPDNFSTKHGNITPVEALSPFSHKWTIRVRVTHKLPMRSWHNQNGEGRLFSVNLLDESGEIRMTGFNSIGEHFDDLYNNFEEGVVYYISSPCQVKMANKKFSQVNNDYELTLERDTKVERAEDQSAVPQVRYHFINIENLKNIEKDTTIDCIGVLTEVGNCDEIVSKSTQKPFSKRELTLVDNTVTQVRLTIWGEQAQKFDVPLETVLAFKGVKVSDFGGRSLSLLSSGQMAVNPDIDDAHKLKGWYDAQGRDESYQNHNNLSATSGASREQVMKTIQEIKDENLGQNTDDEGKPKDDYFTVKATVVWIREGTMWYAACQTEKCNRKVIEVNEGEWRCEMCQKNWPRPSYRYVLSVNVADHTGQLWLSAFDDSGKIIMGVTGDEAQKAKEVDDSALKDIIEAATCKTYSFRCRAKLDTYNDEARVRYQIMYTNQVDFVRESARLAQQIKAFSLADDNGAGLFVQ